MGHLLRLGGLELLRDGEKCVCEIGEYTGTGISNVSKHLLVLKKFGIVNDRREGLKIVYSLTMPCAGFLSTNCIICQERWLRTVELECCS